MTSPTALYVAGAAVLSNERVLVWLAVTVSVSWFESYVTALNTAWAVATFVTKPASRSAWPIVYVAVQVVDAPGARLPGGQLTVALSSVTDTLVRVTLPVLVTL